MEDDGLANLEVVGDAVESIRERKVTKAREGQRKWQEAKDNYRAKIDTREALFENLIVYNDDGSTDIRKTQLKYKAVVDLLYLEQQYLKCLDLGQEYDNVMARVSKGPLPASSEDDAIKDGLLRAALALRDPVVIERHLNSFIGGQERWAKQVDSARLVQEAYAFLQNFDKALDACLIANALDKRYEIGLLYLAELLFAIKEIPLARQTLERAEREAVKSHHPSAALRQRRRRILEIKADLAVMDHERSAMLSQVQAEKIKDFLKD